MDNADHLQGPGAVQPRMEVAAKRRKIRKVSHVRPHHLVQTVLNTMSSRKMKIVLGVPPHRENTAQFTSLENP